MSEDVAFYNAQCIAFAKTLPMAEARSFLKGALELAGDAEEASPLRLAFVALDRCAAQLELFASRQFAKAGVTPGHNGKARKPKK